MTDGNYLKIFELNPDEVLISVRQMLDRGSRQVISHHTKNDSILPAIVKLDNEVTYLKLRATLAATTPVSSMSHCWALIGGRKSTLTWLLEEPGTGQHPRITAAGSTDKIQVYHLTLLASLLSLTEHPSDLTFSGEFTEEAAKNQLDLLRMVSRKNTTSSKKVDTHPLTVAHLCGNGFCVRPSHLRVVNKELNEEHTHCHWIQKVHAEDGAKVASARLLCPHDPKCVYMKYEFV